MGFFRAESISHAITYISGIFSSSLFSIPFFPGIRSDGLTTICLIIGFLFIEWQGREQPYAIAQLGLKWKKGFRYILYYLIIIAIILFGGEQQQFIYFQF